MEFSQIKASFTQQAFRVLPGAVLPHLRQRLPQDHVYGSSGHGRQEGQPVGHGQVQRERRSDRLARVRLCEGNTLEVPS